MRKLKLAIFSLLVAFLVIPVVSAKEKLPKVDENKDPITVYIFRGDGCGYCHQALEYFESIDEKYGDYFNLIGYEVSTADNQELWKAVGEHFGDEIGSIPYIVVGDAYHAVGFQESVGKEIIDIVLEQYQSDKYVDIVDQIATEKGLATKTNYSQNTEFSVLTDAEVGGKAKKEENKTSDTIIVVGIFVVLIGGIAGLVYASKKQ